MSPAKHLPFPPLTLRGGRKEELRDAEKIKKTVQYSHTQQKSGLCEEVIFFFDEKEKKGVTKQSR